MLLSINRASAMPASLPQDHERENLGIDRAIYVLKHVVETSFDSNLPERNVRVMASHLCLGLEYLKIAYRHHLAGHNNAGHKLLMAAAGDLWMVRKYGSARSADERSALRKIHRAARYLLDAIPNLLSATTGPDITIALPKFFNQLQLAARTAVEASLDLGVSLEATKPASSVPDSKTQYARVDHAISVLERMGEAGFNPDLPEKHVLVRAASSYLGFEYLKISYRHHLAGHPYAGLILERAAASVSIFVQTPGAILKEVPDARRTICRVTDRILTASLFLPSARSGQSLSENLPEFYKRLESAAVTVAKVGLDLGYE